MKHWIITILIGFELMGLGTTEQAPVFQKQIIQAPMDQKEWLWPYWSDFNLDARTDLLLLAQKASKLFVYEQGPSGFPDTPSQTLTLPTDTAWITLGNVNDRPGEELLISTSEGLAYYPQEDGLFVAQPQPLIQAEQIIPHNHPPIIKQPKKWMQEANGTFPMVSRDQTVVYRLDHDHRPQVMRTVPHAFKHSIEAFQWTDWSVGSTASVGLKIHTTAQQAVEPRPEAEAKQENEAIEKLVQKIKTTLQRGEYGIEKKDFNADGQQDLAVWYFSNSDWDVRTTLSVFLRQANNQLPPKPSQILRCAGLPMDVNNERDSVSFSLFRDIDNNGTLEMALISLRNKPVSVGNLIDMLVSKGLDCTISVRTFGTAKGFSRNADFQVPVTTMLPLYNRLSDLITLDHDFNGDGKKDLMVRRDPVQYDIYLSSPQGQFIDPKPTLQLAVPERSRMRVLDLNNDRFSDLYAEDLEQHQITVYLSQ
jgi:hypothetical protein